MTQTTEQIKSGTHHAESCSYNLNAWGLARYTLKRGHLSEDWKEARERAMWGSGGFAIPGGSNSMGRTQVNWGRKRPGVSGQRRKEWRQGSVRKSKVLQAILKTLAWAATKLQVYLEVSKQRNDMIQLKFYWNHSVPCGEWIRIRDQSGGNQRGSCWKDWCRLEQRTW